MAIISAQPQLILLAGTSSAGKTTTSNALAVELEASGKTVAVLAFDDMVDVYKSDYVKFLDELLEENGFEGSITQNIQKAHAGELSKADCDKLESLVETQGTQWLHQKLVLLANENLAQGNTVIIDTLDTHDVLEKVTASDTSIHSQNILLTVPFNQFADRVHQRNLQALANYEADYGTNGYKDCRDPFDMISQYALFYRFEGVDSAEQGMTKYQIRANLTDAFDKTIWLLDRLHDSHTKHSLIASSERDKLIQKAKECLQEKEQLQLSKAQKIEEIVESLTEQKGHTHFKLAPKAAYDLVLDTTLVGKDRVAAMILENDCSLSKFQLET